MSEEQLFILITVLVSIIIVGLFFFLLIRKRQNKDKENHAIAPLASAALICIVIGITFGDVRWLGYGFIGLGMILALIELVIQSRKRN